MGPDVDPVLSDASQPARSDVVVIGGGIIGASSALFLAGRGLSVVLLEKGRIAGEQSSRNWGWCRQANRDPREFDLIRESMVLWRGLNERVGAETGFRTTGILYAARDEATKHAYREWVRVAADSGIAACVTSGADLARLLPHDTSLPAAALYCASDGRAEPAQATSAIAQAGRRAGVAIVSNCAARGIETAGGRVVSVVTERGTIACGSVVVAGGAWSRRLLSDLDVEIPQLKVRASVARTTSVDGGPQVALWDGTIAFRRRADGGYTVANGHATVVPLTPDSVRLFARYVPAVLMDWRAIKLRLDGRFLTELREGRRVPFDRPSPYEAARTLDPAPDARYLESAMAALRQRFSAFATARIAQSWAGFIDSMPDIVPVISEVDGILGLVVATGFSGHGFGIGPGAGKAVADLVAGANPFVDLRAFRLSRFFDGTRPRPTSGL